MNTDEPGTPVSEGGALVRLGLKVAFGTRGEYIAEYLDDRRAKRVAERLLRLGELTAIEGVEPEEFVARIESDDAAAEFVERVIDIASRTRYDPKLRYLARCLVNAVATDDDAVPEMSWAKIAAIENMEAIHARLLHEVKAAQDRRAAVARSEARGVVDLAVAESVLIENKERGGKGLPASTFHTIMAVLVRDGLVVGELSVDVDLDVSIDVEDGSMDGSPDVSTEMMYRLTALGREVLEQMHEVGADDD